MKKGFASVYIVLILGSLVAFVILTCEIASGFAAGSIADNLCMLAGRSVLSEFDQDLYRRYGIFALRSDGLFLEDMYSYYLQNSLGSYDGFLAMSCEDALIDTEGFAGLDASALEPQIIALGKLYAAKHAVDSDGFGSLVRGLISVGSKGVDTDQISQMLSDLKEEASQEEEAASEDYTQDQNEYGEGSPESAAQSKAKKKKSQISSLRTIYESSRQAGEACDEDGAEIPSEYAASLPSALLGTGSRSLLLLAGGLAEISADTLFADEYLLEACGNMTEGRDGAYLKYQCEYLLFGKPSDRENAKYCKSSIFRLRTALNTGALLADSNKLSALSAAAALGFGLIPKPAAVLILAAAWGAAEAAADVDELFSGGSVPYIKLSGDWRISLDSLLEGITEGHISSDGPDESPDSACGDYKDYLRILLAMVPADEKTIRLMDLMQMDMNLVLGRDLQFRDFCYGFNICAELDKEAHFGGFLFERIRHATIRQSHSYQ